MIIKPTFNVKLPYLMSTRRKKYGIKIKSLYNEGNDGWLSVKNSPSSWAVGFHAYLILDSQAKIQY